jgi:hypothetical protein
MQKTHTNKIGLRRCWSMAKVSDALERLFAAIMLVYTGGVELTGFSDTLLDNPSLRVPFFAFAWTVISLLALANAHEAAGKGTLTALTARALSPWLFVAGLGVAMLTGEIQLGFIGLLSMLVLWATCLAALANWHCRAFRLFAFAGFPIFLFMHLLLFSIGRLTPVMLWLQPADDATRGKVHVAATITCCFQSVQLLTCVYSKSLPRSKCVPQHLPHERPKSTSISHAMACTSPSTLGVLALVGVAVAFVVNIIYQNIFSSASSHQESIGLSISVGSERRILAGLQLSEVSTERASLWWAFAISVIGAVLVVSRMSREQIESRLTPVRWPHRQARVTLLEQSMPASGRYHTCRRSILRSALSHRLLAKCASHSMSPASAEM